MKTRKYRQRKRAEQQEETRQRIVNAAMALHEEVGPRDTSVKAVAERAGVERLTVYRHFPDQVALFQACTAHWLSLNPLPERSGWQAASTIRERGERMLEGLYAYYRKTESMWARSYRDREDVAALHGPMAEVDRYLEAMSRDLLEGRTGREARVTARHVLEFATWQSLHAQGLSEKAKISLALQWLDAVSFPGHT